MTKVELAQKTADDAGLNIRFYTTDRMRDKGVVSGVVDYRTFILVENELVENGQVIKAMLVDALIDARDLIDKRISLARRK